MRKELQLPLVTVILPAYNHEKYVGQAIKSVFDQSYEFIQLIVINDGSADNTVSVIERLRRVNDFEFINNEINLGLAKSLNIALSYAKGKYVSILAGDDYLDKEKTRRQVEYLEAHEDIAACSGRVITVDGVGKVISSKSKSECTEVTYREFSDFFLLNSRFPAVVTMVRRQSILNVGGYDEKYYMEDMPLWLKLTYDGSRLAVLPEVLGYYRIHGTNTHKNRGPMFENQMRLLSEYKDHSLYDLAVRNAYSRQIRFGPTLGLRHLMMCVWRGFSFSSSYFRNILICARSCISKILDK